MQARSKLPQKKCTGLTLPTNAERNAVITRLAWTSCPQNRRTAAASYDACSVSCAKGTASGTSTGTGRMATSTSSSRSAAMVSA